MNTPIRSLLVDDSPYFLDVVRDFLAMQDGLQVVGEVRDGPSALEQARLLQPDVILLDLNLGAESGMKLIPPLKECLPQVKIVVLTIQHEDSYRTAAFEAGADAFVNKTHMLQDLISTIKNVTGDAILRPVPGGNSQANGEAWFMHLAENTNHLIYRYEFMPRRGFTYVSPSAKALTGYTPEEYYADPDLGFKLVHPADRSLLERPAQGGVEPNQSLLLRWVRKDGSVLWTEQRNVNIFNEAGELTAIEGIARDVTDRVRADELLQASERFMRETLDSLNDHIAILDETGMIVMVNRSWRRFAGLNGIDAALVSEKVNYLAVCDAATGEDAAQAAAVAAGIRSVLRGERELYELEYPCHSPYDKRWFMVRVTRFQGAEPLWAVVAHENITEQKLAEQATLQSEARYRQLFESNPHPMWVYDLTSLRFLAVNDAAVMHYGYSRDEFFSMTIKDIRPPEDVERLLENVTRVTDGLDQAGIWRHVKKGGEVIQVELSSHVLEFDGRRAEMVLAHDITNRLLAEEKLRLSESRYRLATQATKDVIWEWDIQSHRLAWSDNLQTVFGYAFTEVGPDETWWNNHLHPDDRNRVIAKLDELIASDVSIWSDEYRFLLKDGSYAHISDRGFIERSAGGGAVRMIGAMSNITGHKRAEVEIRRRVTELEALYESGIAISQMLDPQAIGAKLIEVLASRLNWHHAAVREKNADGSGVTLLAFSRMATPDEDARFSSVITKVGQGMAGWVIEHGEPIRSSNIMNDPRYKETFAGMASGIYIPIKLQGKTIGCISAESERENEFSEDDERLLTTVAAQAAVALENARLFQNQQKELAERRQAENALAESEARYRSLLDQLPAIVYLDDVQASPPITQFVSPHIQDMLGYSPELWLAGGFDRWKQSIHPDDRERVLRHFSDSLEHEVEYSQDYRLITHTGRVIWVHDSATIQRDENGKPLTMQGVVYDITENRNAELAMRLQSAALESADNAIAITNRDGTIQWVNPAYTRLTGYTEHEMFGENPRILRSGVQDESFYKNLWDTILSGKVWRGEMINKRKNGTLYAEEQTITPLSDDTGEVTHFIAIKQDITHRKQAEEQIRQQLERLTALRSVDQAITSSFDMQANLNLLVLTMVKLLKVDAAAIWVMDQDSHALVYTAGTGFHAPRVEDSRIQFGESFVDFVARERRLVQVLDLEGAPPQRLFGYSMAEKFVGYRGLPLLIKDQVIGVVEVFHRTATETDDDWMNIFETLAAQATIAINNAQLFSSWQQELAERKVAEEKLRQSHTELEKIIEVRTSDLQQINFDLERALRVKDEFLANMSHELRTPLNAVIGLSDSLLEQTAGPLNEKQEKYLGTVRESGQHLLELINDILDLAKVEAGQVTLNIETVDVSMICQSSLRMIKQLASKKDQEVFFEMDGDIDVISVDERRLKQMIVNLLSNAVKFTPEKGKLGLQVQGNYEAGTVSFTVWDSGIGIHENDLKRLFQPFVQLDSKLARKSEGTGLGLALVAKMASLHGGSVSVESQPDHGSRFTITLPWEPGVGEAATHKTTKKIYVTRPLAANQNHMILIVDDTESVILVLRDYLEYAGFRVAVARNGLEALAHIEMLAPSLILMDVQMPGLDGLEATRRIRAMEAFARTPIIALTALAMKGDRERCLEAGMNDYISKPVNLRALAKLIQEILSSTAK